MWANSLHWMNGEALDETFNFDWTPQVCLSNGDLPVPSVLAMLGQSGEMERGPWEYYSSTSVLNPLNWSWELPIVVPPLTQVSSEWMFTL